MFESIDSDGDGVLEPSEMSSIIRNIGHDDFDDEHEIKSGVERSLEFLDANDDDSVSSGDVSRFLSNIKSLLTVEEVVDWIQYAVMLPQYASHFKNSSVTGLDFFDLLDEDQSVLRDDLGISNKLHRKKIVRSIKLRILGIAGVPEVPTNVKCVETKTPCEYTVMWTSPDGNGLPIQSYTVESSDSDSSNSWFSTPDSSMSWTSVEHSSKTRFDIVNPDVDGDSFRVRVRAWNGAGHGDFSVSTICNACPRESSSQSKSFFSIFDIVSNLYTLIQVVLIIGFLIQSMGYARLFFTKNIRVKDKIPLRHEGQGENARNEHLMRLINRCRVCKKEFGWLGFRRKHYCKQCKEPFCGNHGVVNCTLAGCAIGGECICQVCMGAILVKRVKTSPKHHSNAKKHWSRIKDVFISSDDSRSKIRREISSGDEGNSMNKKSSASPISFFRKFRKKASLKRLRNPSSLLNVDVNLNASYDRFQACYPNIDQTQWKCIRSVYVGAGVQKRLCMETFFRNRYVWVNVTKKDDSSRKSWSIHWSKSETKHIYNKTLSVRDDISTVKRQGKETIEIQCKSSHPSVVLKFDSEAQTLKWYEGLKSILVLSSSSPFANNEEKEEEEEEEKEISN